MAALTTDRKTDQYGTRVLNDLVEGKIKANVKIFGGAIAMLDPTDAGRITKGAATRALVALGRSETRCDNTGGAADAMDVKVRQGTFPWENSAAADAIAQKHAGQSAYVVDDNTVALSSGGGARPFAGRIEGLDADGKPLITMGKFLRGYVHSFIIPVQLAAITANDQIAARFTPGFKCKLQRTEFVVTTPVTTGAKLATLSPEIAAVAVTGGALALTSANCTPIGAKVAGTAVTAAFEIGDGQEVTFKSSAVTAFVEGQGYIIAVVES